MPSPFSAVLCRPLRQLLLLQTKAKLRRGLKRLRSPRRAIPTLLVAVLMVLYVLQIYIALSFNDQSRVTVPIEALAPLGMLGILFLKLLGVCIDRNKAGAGFRSVETHQLLGGPFSREQVRLFRVTGHAVSIFFTSVFAAIFFRFHVPSFLAALSGAYLAMLFTYLVYTTIAVAAVNATEAMYNRARNVTCTTVVVMLGYCLFSAASEGHRNLEFVYAMGNQAIWLTQTWVGRVLMSPFTVFTRIIVADSLRDWVAWIGPGLLVNYAALQLLLRSEACLVSRAWHREEQAFDLVRLQRSADHAKRRCRQSVADCARPLPWLGGAGPILWRQWRSLTRLKGGMGWLMIPLACAFAMGAYVAYSPADGAFQTIAVVVLLTSVFLPGLIPFDFRGDLKGLVTLKMMPIRPRSVVLGQLAVPVFVLSCFQCLALSTLVIHDRQLLPTILVTMLFLIPINTIILALENLIFLLYPYRVADFDMQATVRRVVMLMMKFCVLFLAGLVALVAGFGVLALRFTTARMPYLGEFVENVQKPLLVSTQLMALVAVAGLVVSVTCWSYRRFDLSEDLPL